MQRKARPWIKVQLSGSERDVEAGIVVKTWKQSKSAARSIVNAIMIYQALQTGNLDRFYKLINEFFPGMALALAGSNRASMQPSVFQVAGRSEEVVMDSASIDDLLSAGLDDF